MDDLDRICDEFHATHDPVEQLRIEARMLAHQYVATFSDPTIYDRKGRARAREEWIAAMPSVLPPPSLGTLIATTEEGRFWRARERRSQLEGRELLDLVQALAELHEGDTLTKQVNRAAAWMVEAASRRGDSKITLESMQRRIWRWIAIYRSELHPEFIMKPAAYD
jgi:hypothetical protein